MEKFYYFASYEVHKCGEFQYFDDVAFLTKKQAKNYINKHLKNNPRYKNVHIIKKCSSDLVGQMVYYMDYTKHVKNDLVAIKL